MKDKGTLLQISGAVVDLVYTIDRLPAPGEEVLAGSSAILPGGGFNAMFAARRAGMRVSYGGAHGTGPFADLLRAALAENRIPILQERHPDLDQGTCVSLIDRAGERTFVSKDGAEGALRPDSLAGIDPARFDWILLSGYTLCYRHSRNILRDWVTTLPAGSGFVFDPSPVVAQIPGPILTDVLAKVAWLSCNDREARALTGCETPRDAAASLLKTHCPTARGVLVRLGADGCLLQERGKDPVGISGFPVAPVVDTNGAGDTHIGAFLAALSRDETPADAARTANAAAALSTLKPGPATAPDHAETMAFLKDKDLDRKRSDKGKAHPDAAPASRLAAGRDTMQTTGSERRKST